MLPILCLFSWRLEPHVRANYPVHMARKIASLSIFIEVML